MIIPSLSPSLHSPLSLLPLSSKLSRNLLTPLSPSASYLHTHASHEINSPTLITVNALAIRNEVLDRCARDAICEGVRIILRPKIT
jgi:hypothetical protein